LPKTAGAPGSFWREIKTYKHYAYIVSDGARNHGMQIFDPIACAVSTPQTFTEDAHMVSRTAARHRGRYRE